jgi:hypothetical protein
VSDVADGNLVTIFQRIDWQRSCNEQLHSGRSCCQV